MKNSKIYTSCQLGRHVFNWFSLSHTHIYIALRFMESPCFMDSCVPYILIRSVILAFSDANTPTFPRPFFFCVLAWFCFHISKPVILSFSYVITSSCSRSSSYWLLWWVLFPYILIKSLILAFSGVITPSCWGSSSCSYQACHFSVITPSCSRSSSYSLLCWVLFKNVFCCSWSRHLLKVSQPSCSLYIS